MGQPRRQPGSLWGWAERRVDLPGPAQEVSRHFVATPRNGRRKTFGCCCRLLAACIWQPPRPADRWTVSCCTPMAPSAARTGPQAVRNQHRRRAQSGPERGRNGPGAGSSALPGRAGRAGPSCAAPPPRIVADVLIERIPAFQCASVANRDWVADEQAFSGMPCPSQANSRRPSRQRAPRKAY